MQGKTWVKIFHVLSVAIIGLLHIKAVFVEVEYSASGGGSWQLITLNIKKMEE